MKFEFTTVDEIITNISRKYSRNTSVEFEDFYQDLWVKALELDCENIAILTTSLVNKAVDLSRKDWKESKYRTGNEQNDWNDDDREEFMYKNASQCMSENTDIVGYLTLLQNIDKLSDRCKTFVISKAYLNGFYEFEDKYNKILVEIPADRLDLLDSYEKDDYSDDIILKVFCGIKTGVNAGSARAIKNEIKAILLS